nr:seroin 1B [Andraca theae]
MGHTTILLIVSVLVVSSAAWMFDDSPFPGFAPPKINFKMPEFKKIEFDMPTFNMEPIKDHVAGVGEKYSGVSISSHSYSSNVNGKKTSGGGISTLTNDGSAVEEKAVEYHND